MTIHPSITFEQHQSDLQVIRARLATKKPNQLAASLLGGVIGIVFSVILINPKTRILGVGLFLAALALWLYTRKQYRQNLLSARHNDFARMQPILNGNEMTLDPSGIKGTWVGNHAGYDFTWRAFDELLDLPDRILFLYAPCCYIRVPKAELSSSDLMEILNWYKQAKSIAN